MADASQGGTDSVMARVSVEMVRLYKHLFGRRPTKTRSVWAGEDAIVCTLENTLTATEQRLVAMGEHKALRDTRMLVQRGSEQEFVETVERLTGRNVRAVVSGLDTHHDLSTEVFYLEPEPGRNGQSRESF